ncbi:FIST N-terminal domain-containing protein [Clostridium felsineum]|uniref:FIST N-terminal domain-containing protein n=1 Tax=Clostridium felsineum TaxID=36839 RepID=UPI00098C7269|nr:FIST N-terminal domain-containing protein [Clostridium felsineum]URZ16645.1 hypothetical protein CLFE_026920 [Clostridium felsineum DSM 794]
MKQQIGTSSTGNLSEAVKGFFNPSLIILLSNENKFKGHVEELEQLYPGVPSIGCICTSYTKFFTIENGITVIAFSDCVSVAANVILELSSMPVKYISRMENDIKKVKAESENTICIDFATGNHSCLMTTLGSILENKHISLIGTGVDCNMVSCNGVIYEDACAYVFIKNNGRLKAYKETIYKPTDLKMVVTKADSKKYILYELNGKPAESVYCDYLNISPNEMNTQYFRNPLGKWVGDEFCIMGIAQLQDKSLQCYKRINNTDIISILELDDYKKVINNTVTSIKNDMHHISGIFSMNCTGRYTFFGNVNYWKEYLKTMNFADNHVGIVAMGEHFNSQHVNLTMVCFAFE